MADERIFVNSPLEHSIKITKWKVKQGFPVTNNQVILLYEIPDGNVEIRRLKSLKSGVVKKRLYDELTIIEPGTPLLELSECVHTTVMKDMCADCGADLRQNDEGNTSEAASVPMIHSVPELKVTKKLAEKLGQADTLRLLEDRRLVLLVDLDQTIIHTTNDNVPNNIRGIYHFQLYGPNSPWYHTRFRPMTVDFLSKMARYFELHICTFGARNYAHTIAQFLDPDHKYFAHRILSRDECFNITSKTDNLKALFPCGDSMVCIIDDREDVWNMASNLIQVKPYHFFQHTGDINAPPGLSKTELDGKGVDFKEMEEKKDSPKEVSVRNSEETEVNVEKTSKDTTADSEKDTEMEESKIDIDDKSKDLTSQKNDLQKEESPTLSEQIKDKEFKDATKNETEKPPQDNLIDILDPDDYLLHLETILMTIYNRFYEIYDQTKEIPDLKILIPKIRSEVLREKHLVFSGLVPNHMKLEQSRAYMIARSLGANVSQHFTDSTTHLVAVTSGTLKVNSARKRPNIHIVTPDWLWSCAERWEHVEEMLFPLDPHKPSKMRQPPAHCHSPEHVVNYNEKAEISAEQPEPKFIDTINPLLSFSNADLAEMNKEFDQFFEEDSSSDDEPVNMENPPVDKNLRKRKREEEKEERHRTFFSRTVNPNIAAPSEDLEKATTSSEDEDEEDDISPSEKFRRGEDLPSDLDLDSKSGSSNDPIDEDGGDWNMMGAALEREFLGLE